jgi:hypothetical protein
MKLPAQLREHHREIALCRTAKALHLAKVLTISAIRETDMSQETGVQAMGTGRYGQAE